MVTFETSSAILTIIRSIQAFHAGGSSWRLWREGLAYMIFEEGILYFIIISAFTTSTLILICRSPPGSDSRLLNGLTLPLSGLLTARFLLHIRHWKHKRATGGLLPSSTEHGINLGTSLELSTMEFRVPSSNRLSSLIDDFGSDPVARMVTEGPSFRGEDRFSIYTDSCYEGDDIYIINPKKEEDDDDDLSINSSRSGEFAV
ncbi:hypothetical protein EIP91_011503 [Steccherinum ochraceum]|uniref:Uncharacterized protein n=1 Tax=Steccherinum ochraceum TaxID=92696 RepID=A0A4V2MWZ3_9APHY|nr:hypothetical protein EIP91_011503 [Steccherinum ochraceum]